jgi:hypothetical protein
LSNVTSAALDNPAMASPLGYIASVGLPFP